MHKMKNEKSTRMIALMLIGLMIFSTVGVLANNDNSEPIIGIGYDDNSENLVKIEIFPINKIAESNENGEGVASYKVVITDNHESSSVSALDNFKYALQFEVFKEGIEGSFVEYNAIELGRMESETIELKVLTKNLGVSGFIVRVIGEDAESYAKGKIVFGKKLKPILSTKTFFNGKGLARQADNSESVYLKLLRESDNKIFGKIKIGEEDFRVEGFVEREKIKFDIFNIMSVSARGTNFEVASFEGIFEKYEGSILIKGNLIGFEGKDFELTLMPKNIGKITNAELGVKKRYSVEFQETIAVSDKTSIDADDKVYFNLVKVKPKKFLWVFPTKKKLVELEVIRGKNVFTKRITENSIQKIEGYSVSVGDLSDEDNIEFNIEDLE